MTKFSGPKPDEKEKIRASISIKGKVQGVGFRPFVYRLAKSLGLRGRVNNSSQGVYIEAEGTHFQLEEFLRRLEKEKPSCSSISDLESSFLAPLGYLDFQINKTEDEGKKTTLIPPDMAICRDCLSEIFDSQDRRYQYPFTNCTYCGPRFSIITGLPYDRANTSMQDFEMCKNCREEYNTPENRRFHAQPNACHDCGPYLELWNLEREVVCTHHKALLYAVEAIRAGAIVAVKGLGGFHLMVDAQNKKAVQTLRKGKLRKSKPLALMYPNIEKIAHHCEVSELEKKLLLSPAAPIVLLLRKQNIYNWVSPQNPYFGIMLPYTPLHALIMSELQSPLVVTSGNIAEEPICTNENQALEKLAGLAQFFLVHNRRISHRVDDSIARIIRNREMVIRRARGYTQPVSLPINSPPILAVGSHLKNTVAIAVSGNAFVSQHIGNLETAETHESFSEAIAGFKKLYDLSPEQVVCDTHPDYQSTRFAKSLGLPLLPVQHHYAHILSCMAENRLSDPLLGISWDGSGYGMDKTIWGGEFLKITKTTFERVAHFRTFSLPGNEKAVQEPRRAALGLLFEIYQEKAFHFQNLAPLQAFSQQEKTILQTMLEKKLNTPRTSSVGRIFDALASLLNLCQISEFEGQAATLLEFSLEKDIEEAYPIALIQSLNQPLVVDWQLMFEKIIEDICHRVAVPLIVAKFHNSLVEAIIQVTKWTKENTIALSGGCFQNKYLTEYAVRRLEEEGFSPYWHQYIPPNDEGISLGQIFAACRLQNMEGSK